MHPPTPAHLPPPNRAWLSRGSTDDSLGVHQRSPPQYQTVDHITGASDPDKLCRPQMRGLAMEPSVLYTSEQLGVPCLSPPDHRRSVHGNVLNRQSGPSCTDDIQASACAYVSVVQINDPQINDKSPYQSLYGAKQKSSDNVLLLTRKPKLRKVQTSINGRPSYVPSLCLYSSSSDSDEDVPPVPVKMFMRDESSNSFRNTSSHAFCSKHINSARYGATLLDANIKSSGTAMCSSSSESDVPPLSPGTYMKAGALQKAFSNESANGSEAESLMPSYPGDVTKHCSSSDSDGDVPPVPTKKWIKDGSRNSFRCIMPVGYCSKHTNSARYGATLLDANPNSSGTAMCSSSSESDVPPLPPRTLMKFGTTQKAFNHEKANDAEAESLMPSYPGYVTKHCSSSDSDGDVPPVPTKIWMKDGSSNSLRCIMPAVSCSKHTNSARYGATLLDANLNSSGTAMCSSSSESDVPPLTPRTFMKAGTTQKVFNHEKAKDPEAESLMPSYPGDVTKHCSSSDSDGDVPPVPTKMWMKDGSSNSLGCIMPAVSCSKHINSARYGATLLDANLNSSGIAMCSSSSESDVPPLPPRTFMKSRTTQQTFYHEKATDAEAEAISNSDLPSVATKGFRNASHTPQKMRSVRGNVLKLPPSSDSYTMTPPIIACYRNKTPAIFPDRSFKEPDLLLPTRTSKLFFNSSIEDISSSSDTDADDILLPKNIQQLQMQNSVTPESPNSWYSQSLGWKKQAVTHASFDDWASSTERVKRKGPVTDYRTGSLHQIPSISISKTSLGIPVLPDFAVSAYKQSLSKRQIDSMKSNRESKLLQQVNVLVVLKSKTCYQCFMFIICTFFE